MLKRSSLLSASGVKIQYRVCTCTQLRALSFGDRNTGTHRHKEDCGYIAPLKVWRQWQTLRISSVAQYRTIKSGQQDMQGKRAAEDLQGNNGSIPKKIRAQVLPDKVRILKGIDRAAKSNNLEEALSLFNEARDKNVALVSHSCHVVLHLLAGGEDWADRLTLSYETESTKNESSLDGTIAEIFDYMKGHKMPFIEFTYTGLARVAALSGDPKRALSLARECRDSKEKKTAVRLRTYTPALLGFCLRGDMEKALEIEKEIRSCDLDLTEQEYSMLLRGTIKAQSPDFANYVLQCMARDVFAISEPTAKVIEELFMGVLNGDPKENSFVDNYSVSRSTVDDDGVCSASQLVLKAFDLSKSESASLSSKIQKLGSEGQKQQHDFQAFERWLNRKGPFDTIIDGANVGFFGQSKAQEFSLRQVKQMFEVIKERHPERKVLIVLHNRRIRDFENGNLKDFIAQCRKDYCIYATPSGANDDWYWLYAAVRAGESSWLITNDEMRDHIFQTLSAQYFQRWKDRHQIRFDIKNGIVRIFQVKKYTPCIQQSTKGWHFPVLSEETEDVEEKWVCAVKK